MTALMRKPLVVKTEPEENSLEWFFPPVDPQLRPFGSRVLLQLRRPMYKSKGGVLIPEEARETEKYNTQVGLVRALGPLAFHHRTSKEPWPEGAWCKVGDFVRVSKYAGDRFEVSLSTTKGDVALFVIFDDQHLIGLETGDPLARRAFL